MKKRLWRILCFLFVSAGIAAIPLTGILTKADNTLADALYQHPQALENNIVVIGIDQRALDDLGPFQTWGREVTANAIDMLNADPENKPAVIGIDILFGGETDPEQDAVLADAAGQYGNVVLAAFATFGSELETQENGDFYLDDYAVTAYEEPYEALKQATQQGHINAMYDTDGILRHAILQVDLPDGRQVPSFHKKIYQMYAQQHGLDPNRLPPTDSRHRWYLPYRALPGSYDDGYSLTDLLAGEIPPELFADKIVLIGPYDAGFQDSVTTAIDHAKPMFGLEYQANAIDTLLAGDFKQAVPLWPQMLILFAVLFLCLLCFWKRPIWLCILVWLGVSGASIGTSFLFWQGGLVVSVLYFPSAVTLFFVACVAANYVYVAMERRRVTNTFQRYVAPEIVREILKEGSDSLSLGGKLTDIAILFVDIRGFTTLSEKLEPEQVVGILNRYLTLTSTCILKNGGTLDKFVGDATMAFWGAPLPQEDSVFQAVKAALDMVDGVKSLSEELMEQFGRTVSFGIGVHYGPAVVGNIGAPTRMDYTAIGDSVNTASRLESNAPAGTILVSRAVADILKDRVAFTSLGDSIQLKGKAAGFEVLRVEGLLPLPQADPER